MRVQISDLPALIQRVLLQVQARGIDMRSQDMQPFLQRAIAEVKEHDRFIHHHIVDLVLRLQRLLCVDDLTQAAVAMRLRHVNSGSGAFPLRLVF